MAKRKYIGPALADLMKPATWATAPMPRNVNDDGRRQRGQAGFRVKPQFASQWLYVTPLRVFVNRDDPTTLFEPKTFNDAVRHFSDVKDTDALMLRLNSVKIDGVANEPGEPPDVITVAKKRLLNIYRPSEVKPVPGDPRRFLRYLRHLFPNRASRRHVERYIATLIARPGVRILYALLLVSKVQGVGKSTLAIIMRELLGAHNCSATTAREITQSDFNSWMAGKRFILVDEVYAGHSAELANTIKPLITMDTVSVNRKFKEPYELSNHAHFLLMSNSRLPLFVEQEDRRWLIPEVTEAKKPQQFWEELHRWLRNGGYGIIAHWAECFVRSKKRGAARTGSHAPHTEAKGRMIEASRSGAEKQLRELSEFLLELGGGDDPKRVILPVSALMEWFRSRDNLSASDRKISERAVLEMLSPSLRVCAGDQRCDTGKRKVTAIINFEKKPEEKWPALVRAGCLWDLTKLREAFDAL